MTPNGLKTSPEVPRHPRPRLTVVEVVYHAIPGEDTTSLECRFGRFLGTAEQRYQRRLAVGADWQPLDCGWLDAGAGMLSLKNDEGKFTQVYPTDRSLSEAAVRVVEIGLVVGDSVHAFAVVRPRESARFEPSFLPALKIRCRSGSARCTLTAFPR